MPSTTKRGGSKKSHAQVFGTLRLTLALNFHLSTFSQYHVKGDYLSSSLSIKEIGIPTMNFILCKV